MAEDLRVEELARATGVTVDTIRFYQKRRLLPPPVRDGRVAYYGAEHVDRLARIRELQGRGFSLAVIRRLLEGELDPADEPLVAAVAGAQRGEPVGDESGELLTLAELATRANVPESILEAVAREGLLVAQVREGVDVYPEADVELVTAGLRLLQAGFPLPDLLALARRHHDMSRGIAEDAVRMFDDYVREPLKASSLSDAEKAQQLVDAFRTLLPTVTSLVSQQFRSVLLEVATEHLESVGEPAELAAARAQPDWGAATS